MKFFEKKRFPKGRRKLYFLGVKVFSYTKKKTPQTNNIKISIIIPVYNVEKYLPKCLDSLLAQTLREIEIICVNDGSTDNSLNVLNEYANRDSRIVIINKRNSGASRSRNIGLKAARGEFVGFVDSDDWVDSNYYEKLYEAATSQKADIARCTYKYCYKERTVDSELNKIILNRISKKKPLRINEHSVVIWNAIYNLKFLKKNKIDYFDPLPMCHDVPFTARVDFLSRKTVPVSGTNYYYRKDREGQLIAPSRKRLDCIMKANILVVNFLNSLPKVGKDEYVNAYKRVIKRIGLTKKAYDQTGLLTEDMLEHFSHHHQKLIKKCKYPEMVVTQAGNNKKELPPIEKADVLVSLTSYPARIKTVHLTVESLLNQSCKPKNVLLWLATEQFPNKDRDLPEPLLALREKGLIIDWYHDIRSYKKLIPTLQKYPKDIIITADDDLIYPQDWLLKLYSAYLSDKKTIWCHRAHRLLLNENGDILPYKQWNLKVSKNIPSVSNFCTSGAGVLYPPRTFHKHILAEDRFMRIAPNADDIWFWAMCILNKKKINIVDDNISFLNIIDGSQEYALWYDNVRNDQNDVQLQRLIQDYPKILKLIRKENRKKADNPIMAYFYFPYYLWKLIKLRRNYQKKVAMSIVNKISTMRIDIKNIGTEKNALSIKAENVHITQPGWFANAQGIGQLLESSEFKIKLDITVINSGKLTFKFLGKDKRYEKERLPLWVDYKSIKINSKEILSAPIATWYDKPFGYDIPVKDGQQITVEVEQTYHIYTQAELENLIIKLNLMSEYVSTHIRQIAKHMNSSILRSLN